MADKDRTRGRQEQIIRLFDQVDEALDELRLSEIERWREAHPDDAASDEEIWNALTRRDPPEAMH